MDIAIEKNMDIETQGELQVVVLSEKLLYRDLGLDFELAQLEEIAITILDMSYWALVGTIGRLRHISTDYINLNRLLLLEYFISISSLLVG